MSVASRLIGKATLRVHALEMQVRILPAAWPRTSWRERVVRDDAIVDFGRCGGVGREKDRTEGVVNKQ